MDFYIATAFLSLLVLIYTCYGIYLCVYGRPYFNRSAEGLASKSILRFLIEAPSWVFGNIPKYLAKHHVSPNYATAISMLCAFTSGFAFAKGWFGLGAVFIFISGIFDLIDGQIARINNICSASGSLTDSIADRYGEFSVYLGLAFYYQAIFPVVILILFSLAGSLIVGYISLRGEIAQIKLAWNFFRRPGRIFILGLSGLATSLLTEFTSLKLGYPMILALMILAIGINIEAIKNYFSIYKALKNQGR